jgi:hypothetical protein
MRCLFNVGLGVVGIETYAAMMAELSWKRRLPKVWAGVAHPPSRSAWACMAASYCPIARLGRELPRIITYSYVYIGENR